MNLARLHCPDMNAALNPMLLHLIGIAAALAPLQKALPVLLHGFACSVSAEVLILCSDGIWEFLSTEEVPHAQMERARAADRILC